MTGCRILRTRPIVSRPTRPVERCLACKTSPWWCRTCGERCCEHRCTQLDPTTRSALCGKCSLRGVRRRS